MHVSHPDFYAPTNLDVPIWRYMDLAKLASMCQSDALHFARANIMEDVFEGSTSQATVDARRSTIRPVTDAEFNEYDKQMTAGAKYYQQKGVRVTVGHLVFRFHAVNTVG